MNATATPVSRVMRRVALSLLGGGCGVAAGFHYGRDHAHAFALLLALIMPLGASVLSLELLRTRAARRHWLVPFDMALPLMTFAYRPHAPTAAYVAVAAWLGVLVTVRTDRFGWCRVGIAVCGFASAFSLIAPLLQPL